MSAADLSFAADSGRPGPGGLAFGPASRLLVVAPHPDDETIAAAGLMQEAHGAGAAVQVWLLTDGDNNPWPQRWAERRWRIDPAARRRWGGRRRAESLVALQQLGLDPASTLQAFGWPDGGLTDRFIADPAGLVAALAAGLRKFSPTDLVIPAATDRHPDHGMAGLLMTLATGQAGLAPRLLSYRVHGGRLPDSALLRELDDGQWAAKQQATAAYATQMLLTGPRLRRMAGRREAFLADPFWPWPGRLPEVRLEAEPGGASMACDFGWPAPALVRQRLLVATVPAGGPPVVRVVAGPALAALARRRGSGIRLTVPGLSTENCQSFVKLETGRRGQWIFDRYPWLRLRTQANPVPLPREPQP